MPGLIACGVIGRDCIAVCGRGCKTCILIGSVGGCAYLAAIPNDEWRQLVAPKLEKHTEATIVDMDELEEELERVREQGYATASEELEEGAAAAGAVLRDSLGRPVGAISVGGPSSRLTSERLDSLGRELAAVAARLAPFLPRAE